MNFSADIFVLKIDDGKVYLNSSISIKMNFKKLNFKYRGNLLNLKVKLHTYLQVYLMIILHV